MIDPTELRIGNSVSINDIEVTVNHIMGDEDYFDPIILTKEYLLRFGFQEVKPRVGVHNAFAKNGIRINQSNSNNFYYKNRYLYVHQLQNLYYALRGAELHT